MRTKSRREIIPQIIKILRASDHETEKMFVTQRCQFNDDLHYFKGFFD